MAFPDLGDTITIVTGGGVTVTGTMTKINLATQRAWVQPKSGEGTWVPLDVIRKKYGN